MPIERKRQSNSQLNPSAAVLIYNYRDRLGTDNTGATDEQEIDQIILNTVSLRSISTNKTKSQPNGSFEITLAPTKNWVTAITPGSWCVILMGRSQIRTNETKYQSPKVDEKHFKMLGRIESVRVASAVDQQTGALSTTYVVTGTDWGNIFNSYLYVDPAARTQEDTAIGSAMRLLYDQVITSFGTSDTQLTKFNSTNACRAILSFWGIEDPASSALSVATQDKTLAKSLNRFGFPKELSEYMGFKSLKNVKTSTMTEVLRFRSGKLKAYDTYTGNDNGDDEFTDGVGFIEPRSIFGTNTVWQLLNDNCNRPLNELFSDVRFENGQPLLTVYKRVKPFKIHSADDMAKDSVKVNDAAGLGGGTQVFLDKMSSDYKNIRRHQIPKQDVISMNAGTNWRDRYNFVEINFGRQIIKNEKNKQGIEGALKAELQFFDQESIRRDGLLPMSMNVNYIPPSTDGEGTDFKNAIAYKYLAKEWYFNTHKMLNGVLTIVGQDNYIGVGDNIMVPAEVVTPNFNYNVSTISNKGKAYVLAHVESVSHNANVGNNGARTFTTEIAFVRGIITDINGNQLQDKEQTLDQDTSKLTPSDELNADRVFGTSSGKDGKQDPDQQKLRGN